MTNGSSQGVFTIVAVLIFGIFIIISYLLFGDKMQTGLASIFTDGVDRETIKVDYEENLLSYDNFTDIEGWTYYTLKNESNGLDITLDDTKELIINKENKVDSEVYFTNSSLNKIPLVKGQDYYASIDIYIESLDESDGNSVFSVHEYDEKNNENILSYSELSSVSTGKWTTIELLSFSPTSKGDIKQGISFGFIFTGESKFKIKIKNPKVEYNKYSTIFKDKE